jgi:hypothetical protein
MQLYMILLGYLGRQCTKFNAAGWTCWFLRPFILSHVSCLMRFHNRSDKGTAELQAFWTPTQNTTSRMHSKNGRTLGIVHTHERVLLWGWWWPVGPKLVFDQMAHQSEYTDEVLHAQKKWKFQIVLSCLKVTNRIHLIAKSCSLILELILFIYLFTYQYGLCEHVRYLYSKWKIKFHC